MIPTKSRHYKEDNSEHWRVDICNVRSRNDCDSGKARKMQETRKLEENRKNSSPVEDGWEVLGDEPLVVRPQRNRVTRSITLAVEIVWVEGANGSKNSFILLIGEMRVCIFSVPRVEAVVTDHGETLSRKRRLVLEYIVEVLKVDIISK